MSCACSSDNFSASFLSSSVLIHCPRSLSNIQALTSILSFVMFDVTFVSSAAESLRGSNTAGFLLVGLLAAA